MGNQSPNSIKSNNGFKKHVLVVEDDQFALENILISLRNNSLNASGFSRAEEALDQIKKFSNPIIVADIKLPGMSGLEFIRKARRKRNEIKAVVITGYSEIGNYEQALKLKADAFLKKPYDEFEFIQIIQKLGNELALEIENRHLKEKLAKENSYLQKHLNRTIKAESTEIIGESEALKSCLNKSLKVAEHGVNALIVGESGTGKEMIAQYIQHHSRNRSKAFVDLNCATLGPNLVEEELFGHSKGSFTGAHQAKAGLLEVADGGILFLDEITEIQPEIQAKLLRIIETGRFRRIGSVTEKDVMVQFLASTNRPIQTALQENYLREDLFHRLSTVVINIPPLRERMSDFDLLLNHFIGLYGQKFKQEALDIPDQIYQYLLKHHWPGNIRQLAAFIQKWFMFGDESDLDDVKHWLGVAAIPALKHGMLYQFQEGTLSELQKAKYWLVKKALKRFKGNKTHAATHMGMTYNGLLKLLKRFEDEERPS